MQRRKLLQKLTYDNEASICEGNRKDTRRAPVTTKNTVLPVKGKIQAGGTVEVQEFPRSPEL